MRRWGLKVPSLRVLLLSDIGPFNQVVLLMSKRSMLLTTKKKKKKKFHSVILQFHKHSSDLWVEKSDLSLLFSYEGLLIENTGHCNKSRK